MSTKNLARTVIEGGRHGHSKYDRRTGLQDWRAATRRLSRKVTQDPESWDDTVPPKRNREWDDVCHKDRTNPCDRFLASRAGRPWDKVQAEIFKKFDRRKLAGRHVIYDHLIDRVEKAFDPYYIAHPVRFGGGPKFWVDEYGILRHNPKARY